MNRLICIPILSLAPILTLGHHSNAEYDSNVVQELQGEVLSVSWRNPHVELTLRTEDAGGAETVWDLEAQDVNSLSRRGLDGSLINVGDSIRVAGSASTLRANNMSISNVLLPDGTEISIRGNPEPRWSTEHIGFERTTVEEALAAAGEGEGLFRVWMSAAPGGFPAQLPLTSAASAARADWDPADDLAMQCVSSGMPASMRLSPPHPIDLTEQGDTIVLRVELYDIVRTIYMDSEADAAEQPATAQGYSLGHWEGDSLVVSTTRVSWPFFDHLGSIPQSDAVEMTERFTVSDDGNQMVYDLTVTDPGTFTEPVSGRWVMNWRPDLVVEQFECIAPEQSMTANHHLRAQPENLSWGWIPTDKPSVLTIQSGETVRIDTISHHGSTQDEDPVVFLGRYEVQPEEILQDVRDFWASRPERPREGRTGAHVLTGPIEITGAEPGDMLEVQILEVSTRVPYGFNSANAQGGALGDGYPGWRAGDSGADISGNARTLIRTAVTDGQEFALLGDSLRIPLAPFMGIMAVAPRDPTVGEPGVTVAGVQGSRPPGAYGGNLDIKLLTAGSTLYLPIFRAGAHFYAGDPHAVQGDGEVSGTALEHSLTGVFRFVLHKGNALDTPRAETDTHYIAVGIDIDLDRALRKAVLGAIDFLVDEKALEPREAFTLASLAIDFTIAEAVNETQVVAALIPKSLFEE